MDAPTSSTASSLSRAARAAVLRWAVETTDFADSVNLAEPRSSDERISRVRIQVGQNTLREPGRRDHKRVLCEQPEQCRTGDGISVNCCEKHAVFELNINVAVDFWRNATRITKEEAKAFVNGRNWWRRRDGYWACNDAVVSLEVVPSKAGMNALVWIVDL